MLCITKEQYNELNKPNAILVIMIIRIFLGVFFSCKEQKIINQEQFEKKYNRLSEQKSKNDLSMDKNKLENSSKQDKDTN